MKRYKRLTTQLILNKVDPLQLDDLKMSFLANASTESCSTTVGQLRLVIRNVLNCDKTQYEERFI